MLDEVRAMLILQDRDRRIAALHRDLEKLPQDEAKAKAKLSGDEAAVTRAHAAVTELELRLKRLELDAATRRTTIVRLKTQQFETRKNDEYQALAHEVLRYEKEADDLETQELELMEEIDAARSALKNAETARDRTRSLVAEDLAGIADRQTRIKAQQQELEAERDKLAQQVPAEMLPLYQRLMKTKGGVALAPLDEGKCGGCHMKLIASTVVAAQSGKELTRCEDCGRILYTPE